jgi:hypothetical protein
MLTITLTQQANMSKQAREENKDECNEFSGYSEALHTMFECVFKKCRALTVTSNTCTDTCKNSLVS